jgi:hypothetical protein
MDVKIEVLLRNLESIEELIGETSHKNLKLRVCELSKRFPKRVFRIVSGHGSLFLDISGKPRFSNIYYGRGSSYSIDCFADDGLGFLTDLTKSIFEETNLLQQYFQNSLNGYAYISGPDFSYKNGKELTINAKHL